MIESLNELANRKPRRIAVRITIVCVCVTADAVLVYALSRAQGRVSSSVGSALNLPLLPGYVIAARLAMLGMKAKIVRAVALVGDAALYSWLACGMPRDMTRTSDLKAPTKTLDI